MVKYCYIHIPFCKNICSYCDFCKLFYEEDLVNSYLLHLEKEIKKIYQGESLKTIYIGGGTPSCLSLKQLEKLFSILDHLKKEETIEYTIECNFNTITEEKLKLFQKYGVNRLSFGLESISTKNLKVLERVEDKNQITGVINLCHQLGFSNINIDIMYAIPNETLSLLEKDLEFVLSLNPTHISTYSLIIEPHTKLGIKKLPLIEEEMDYNMYQMICQKLEKDYIHYEISNFSKEGYQSIHNLCYWKNENYYGFGLGAASYLNSCRMRNTRSMTKYLQDVYILEYEYLEKFDIMSYEMILGLRLLEGVSKDEFQKKYHEKIEDVFQVEELVSKKFLCIDKNIYIPKDKIYVSNEILMNFLKE